MHKNEKQGDIMILQMLWHKWATFVTIAICAVAVLMAEGASLSLPEWYQETVEGDTRKCSKIFSASGLHNMQLPSRPVYTELTSQLVLNQMYWDIPGMSDMQRGWNMVTGKEMITPMFKVNYCDKTIAQDAYRGLFYRVPDGISVEFRPECNFQAELEEYESEEDIQMKLRSSMDINNKDIVTTVMGKKRGNKEWPPNMDPKDRQAIEELTGEFGESAPPNTFSKSTTTNMAVTMMKKYKGSTFIAKAKCTRTRVFVSKELYLSDHFLVDFSKIYTTMEKAAKANEENAHEDVEAETENAVALTVALFDKYGTHYMKAATFGGSVEQIITTNAKQQKGMTDSDIREQAEASYSRKQKSFWGFNAAIDETDRYTKSTNLNEKARLDFQQSSAMSSVIVKGGAPGSFGSQSSVGSPSSWGTWASTVDLLPVVIEPELQSVFIKLFRLCKDYGEYQSKSAEFCHSLVPIMTKAYTQHLLEKEEFKTVDVVMQNSLYEITPTPNRGVRKMVIADTTNGNFLKEAKLGWKASCHNTYCSANLMTRVSTPNTAYNRNWLEPTEDLVDTNWLRIGTIDINSDLDERVVDSAKDDTQIFMCLESRGSKLNGHYSSDGHRPSGATITFSSTVTGMLKKFKITDGSNTELKNKEKAVAEMLRYENCHLYQMEDPVISNKVSITLGMIPQALSKVVYGIRSANENMPPELAASRYVTFTDFEANVQNYMSGKQCTQKDCVDLGGTKTDMITTFVSAYCGEDKQVGNRLADVTRPDLAVTLIEEHPDKAYSQIRTKRPLKEDSMYKAGIVDFDSGEHGWAVSKVVVNICHKRIENPEKSLINEHKCLEYVDQLKDVQHDFVKDAPNIFRITATQEDGDRVLFLGNPVVREHSDYLSTCKTSTYTVHYKPWEIIAAGEKIRVHYSNDNDTTRRRSAQNDSENSANPNISETENPATPSLWRRYLAQWMS